MRSQRLASAYSSIVMIVFCAGPTATAGDSDLETRWNALCGQEPTAAYKAVGPLIQSGDKTVAFVQKELKAVAVRVGDLIAELGAPEYATRKKATAQLMEMFVFAEPVLRKALNEELSPEARSRVTEVLKSIGRPNERWLRRVVLVLETINTANSRTLLKHLADSPPWKSAAAAEVFTRRTGRLIWPADIGDWRPLVARWSASICRQELGAKVQSIGELVKADAKHCKVLLIFASGM